MYESSFGIRELPFRLTPDPRFFFGTRGHIAALAQMRLAAEGGTGFVVVTGDVGSGKTTLVRAFAGDVDASRFAVAHIVNTQLNSDDLIVATALAYGVPTPRGDPAEDASRLLAFLVSLQARGRRALLFIDEAHNVPIDALDRLVSLVRYGAKRHALQVFLIGQPELEPVIESPQMATLRRHVAAWCRLGPMHGDEIRAYVEHRLRKAGWSGSPAFGEGTFEEIHRWTGGIPRNINVLCNRLLLSRLLASQGAIDVETVRATAHEWQTEMATTAVPASSLTVVPQPHAPPANDPGAGREPARATVLRGSASQASSLLCVVANPGDYPRCAALLHALQARADLPRVRIVRLRNDHEWDRTAGLFNGLRAALEPITLALGTHDSGAAWKNEASHAVRAVAERVGAQAVALFGAAGEAVGSSDVAQLRALSRIWIASSSDEGDTASTGATAGWADALYVADAQACTTLAAAGVPAERLHGAGSLLADAVRIAIQHAAPSASHVAPRSALKPSLRERSGYAYVALEHPANVRDRASLLAILGVLREANRDIRLVWPIRESLAHQMQRHRVDGILGMEGVSTIPVEDYLNHVGSMRDATCVLTDSWDVQEEATVLGVPCLTIGAVPAHALTVAVGTNTFVGCDRALATRVLWDCLFNGGKQGSLPIEWDGKAGERIAGHLSGWLPERLGKAAADARQGT